MAISSSVALSSLTAKENMVIGAIDFLSPNLLLSTGVLRIVSQIRHDPVAVGDEEGDNEFLSRQIAAMQIQQRNDSALSDLLKSLWAICSNTSRECRPYRLSNLQEAMRRLRRALCW